MQIQVVRTDGRHEILTLTEPMTVIRWDRRRDPNEHEFNFNVKTGEYTEITNPPKINRIVTYTGMRHLFTEDGLYYGWERLYTDNESLKMYSENFRTTESERIILP
jgi:hypothetical protein